MAKAGLETALWDLEAKASRKRLEGVDSIAMFKKTESKTEEKTYDNAEEMPEDTVDAPIVEDRQPDVKVEEPKPEAKAAEPVKVEAPKAEEPAKAEAPKTETPAPVTPAST